MRIIFDLDGTLIDTRRAVQEAYARVGIIMPDEAWGKPWESWLPQLCHMNWERARLKHEQKNYEYASTLEMVRLLPPAYVANRLVEEDKIDGVGILTGASMHAVQLIQDHIHEIGNLEVYGTELTHYQKYNYVKMMLEYDPQQLVIDDDAVTVHRVGQIAGAILYNGQTEKELYEAIKSWTW